MKKMTEEEILEKAELKMWNNLSLRNDDNGYIGYKTQEFDDKINVFLKHINLEKSSLPEECIRILHDIMMNVSSQIRFGYFMGYKDCLTDNN